MRAELSPSLLLLALALPGHLSAATGGSMWGCAPVGERGNVLYLADQGARSYIKFSGQRIPARMTTEESDLRWSWGSNAMVLDAEGFVRYFEGDTAKATFKCKKMQ